MLGVPYSRAKATRSSGMARLPGMRPSAGSWEMPSFWQKRQEKLQPALPAEKVRVPGKKW